jgi:Carboxypeptidase regulatory-like domain/IPT/TIG domain
MLNTSIARAVMAALLVAAGTPACGPKPPPPCCGPTGPLTVTAISPNIGALDGGTMVRIAGAGFQEGATVTLDGVPAATSAIRKNNPILASTPAHAAGRVDVVVTNPDGDRAVLTGGFTYAADLPGSGTGRVAGRVIDFRSRPLSGATVEVVDGPHAGTSATTDAQGQFSLTGTFDETTQFRASREGYVPATGRSSSDCDRPCAVRSISFQLLVLASTVNMAGHYTLTFIADGACPALPSELRTRTYPATITAAGNGWGFNLAVSGASVSNLGYPPIIVVRDVVEFYFDDDHNIPYLVEPIAPNASLEITGYAAAPVGPSGVTTISTPFSGYIEYAGPPQSVRCGLLKNHRLILTRQ